MAGLVELVCVSRVHVGWICFRLASTVQPFVFPCHRVEVRLVQQSLRFQRLASSMFDPSPRVSGHEVRYCQLLAVHVFAFPHSHVVQRSQVRAKEGQGWPGPRKGRPNKQAEAGGVFP